MLSAFHVATTNLPPCEKGECLCNQRTGSYSNSELLGSGDHQKR